VKNIKSIKNSILFNILFSIIWLSGCANTVTDKTATLRIYIDITLDAGAAPNSNHNYYIIFSSTPSPNIQLPNPPITTTDLYFPTPGQIGYNSALLDQQITYKTLLSLYQNFFYTWSGYIIINNKNTTEPAKFYSSNTTGFNPNTTNNADYISKLNFINTLDYNYNYNATTHTIELNFDISHLDASISNTQYIQVITTEIPDTINESGYFQDQLHTPISIVLEAHRIEESNTERPDPSNIKKEMDIKKCIIRIY
jgi:hypothetical protein